MKLWNFKGLKSCQIRAWSDSKGSNSKKECNLSHKRPLKSHEFKSQAQENNEVCLFEEMTNASALSEQKPPLGRSALNSDDEKV